MKVGVTLRVTLPILLIAAVYSFTPLSAQEFFPAGVSAKSRMSNPSVGSDGPLSLYSNPAQFIAHHEQTDIPKDSVSWELGFIEGVQTYEHPDFDAVKVRVGSPITGLGYQRLMQDFGIGFAVLPTGFGKQKIKGLPRRIAGNYETLSVENETLTVDAVAGMAHQLTPQFSFGASTIMRYEKKRLTAQLVGDDVDLIRLRARNQFYIPTVGIVWLPLTGLDIGLSYRFARTKTYKGTQKSAIADGEGAPKIVNYDPALLSFGVQYQWDLWRVAIDVQQQFYEKGADIVRDGLTAANQASDLKDIRNYALHVRYCWDAPWCSSVSYAVMPSPWGDGSYRAEGDETVLGADLGYANNVDRRAYSLGLSYQLSGLDLGLVAFHSYGSREVGPAGDHPGYYQSQVRGLSFELGYAF